MLMTTILLAQLSVFCGGKENSLRVWSHPEAYHFRAYARAGLPEMYERQTVSLSWPRAACSRSAEIFLKCDGEATPGQVPEGPVRARDLVVVAEGESFRMDVTVNEVRRSFKRAGACKLREETAF